MENRIKINGVEYVRIDAAIEKMVTTCLRYHIGGMMAQDEYEVNALDFCEKLMETCPTWWETFCETYVHKKYPQMFQEKGS